MEESGDIGRQSLNRVLSRQITRRKLLKQLGGVAALTALWPACQSAQQSSGTQATPAAATNPPAAPTAPASSAGPAPKQIALAKAQPMKINWTAASGAMSGIWMAQETGAWKEMGINSELVHIPSSSRVVAAFEAKDIQASPFDWVVAFTSVAAGGSARMIGAVTNRPIFSVMGSKGVTKPEDTKGKRWGITRIGSSTHTASLLALDVWGMKPSDVQFLELQEVPAILSALMAGQVDAGTVSPPTNSRAIKAGFAELINLGDQGPEYPSVGLASTAPLVDGSRDLILAFVAGYSLGVKRFREDPERGVSVIKKYLKLDDQELAVDTHKQFARYLAWPPVMTLKPAERVLQDVVKTEPKAANVKVEQVATMQFTDELEKMGFFK